MARLIVTGVPHPPENEVWCTVCVAFFKGEAFADPKTQERVKAGLADDSRDVFAVAVDGKAFVRQVELAIGWGSHRNTGPAPVPLCATHFPAIDPAQPPPAHGPGAGPGLYRGGSLN